MIGLTRISSGSSSKVNTTAICFPVEVHPITDRVSRLLALFHAAVVISENLFHFRIRHFAWSKDVLKVSLRIVSVIPKDQVDVHYRGTFGFRVPWAGD